MKTRSLFSLMVSLGILGAGVLAKPQSTFAEPAAIFKPILRDIQNQLPRGMVMRLPASLELINFQGKKITIYPILEPYRRGEFRISLNTTPNCQSRSCQFGYIAAFQKDVDNFHLAQRSRGVQITLAEKVSGVYAVVAPRGASSTTYGLAIWEQNNLTFLVSLPLNSNLTLAQNKQRIIDIATSMANEPPIYDIATANSQIAAGRSTNTSTSQRNTINSSAQSSREVQFQVCSQSQTWVRPNEAEQEARLNSLSRYANREYRQSKFWTDNIFLFTSYGLAARHEPVYISGLWKIGDEALRCYQSEGITQKINSGQIAEIWLLQHKVKKIEWQNGRYVMVVAPVQKGAQFINFSRVERQYPLNLKVVSENGTELANLSAPGSPVVTALLPSRNQQTTTGRSLIVDANSPSISKVTVEPGSVTETKNLNKLIGTYAFIVDRLNHKDLRDGSRVLSFDVFNTGAGDGVIEVRNARGELVELRGIEGIRNPTNVFSFPVEAVQRLWQLADDTLVSRNYSFTDSRNSLGNSKKTEIRNIVIPSGGTLKFTKTGENALRYNQAKTVLDILFEAGLPKVFGDDSSLKVRFLTSVYIKLQQERIGNVVKDGAFLTLNDTAKAYISGSWIEKENWEKLAEIGIKVLAEELPKYALERLENQGLQQAQRLVGKKLSFWIDAAENFTKASNTFLQWYDWSLAQRVEPKTQAITFVSRPN